MIDGYSGFIMLDKNGNPKVALHIENEMRWAMKKYKKLHPDTLCRTSPLMCSDTLSVRTMQMMAWTLRTFST